MRYLIYSFALLLLVNLAVLLWPSGSSAAPHVYAPSAAVNPHFIRLNKEIEDRFLNQKPATQAVQLQAASGNDCYRLGPFMHKENYELAQAVLFNAGVEFKKAVRQAKQSTVYRVYLGPFASQAAAVDVRAQLRAKGILDHFVRKQTDTEYVVSLGIYTTQQTASNAVALFDGKLDSVKVAQEDIELPSSYWLHFTLSKDGELLQQLNLMEWGEQSAKLGKYQCNSG